MRLLVPRTEGEFHSIEPFDIFLSDVDILLESKPEGKVRPTFLHTSMLTVFFRMKLWSLSP
jgi:hypothetical protein